MQSDPDRTIVDAQKFASRPGGGRIELEKTRKMPSVPPTPPNPMPMPPMSSGLGTPMPPKEFSPMPETPHHLPVSYKKKAPGNGTPPKIVNKRELANAQMFQEQCRRLCLSLFASDQTPIKSLGFTSSISGEGKSFLAAVTARLLARDTLEAVTLIECNWDHPTLHEAFGISASPGLAEWLHGTCDEQEIRYEASENLTVIPAGDGARDAVRLLKRVQQHGLQKLFKPNELVIIDLPPVITTSYGSLAASLVETVVIVVRSEVTPNRMLLETCAQLKDVPIHGIIINQGNSRIPRWIRQIL